MHLKYLMYGLYFLGKQVNKSFSSGNHKIVNMSYGMQ